MNRTDPRYYQIVALGSLLAYGVAFLQFDITPARCLFLLGAALTTQWLWMRWLKLQPFDPRSALITGLSLCLLLRTDSLFWAGTGAAVAISSKFLLRWRGKHFFNPTNFSLVFLLGLAPDKVWVSPGQWGQAAFFAFLLLCLGGWVVIQACRSDVTAAFLGFYLLVLWGRSQALGEPGAIPLHRLQNGSLLLFAFFMISDPKSTPDSRVGRLLFAILVALGAGFVQFKLFRQNGLLWSLAFTSLLTPVLDRVLPAKRYQWPRSPLRQASEAALIPANYETISP